VNIQCIPAAEIGAAATAPRHDPRRRHLEMCPRCRALGREYRAFMEPLPLPPEARIDWAASTISRRLAREIGTPGGVILPLRPRRSRFGLPPRALWAAAGALVICAGVVLVRDVGRDGDPGLPHGTALLRGEAPAPAALQVTPAADAPLARQLAWSLPAEADASIVVLYDAALRELDRRVLGPVDRFTLDPRNWPAAAAAAHVGVVFLKGDNEVQRTAARPLAAD
jgi:hypothetical protein